MAARRHLSFANVTASVALFIALGGTGYAAAKVRSRDIVNGAVTSSKIAGNAVTGAKVRNGSLSAGDFAPGQLPAGPQGAQGPKGDQGAPGAPGAPGSARGYGLIKSDGTITRAKGIANVYRPVGNAGTFCITLNGIDPAGVVVTATIDWSSSALAAGTFAYWSSTKSPNCSQPGDITIYTLSANNLQVGNAGFSFVIQ
jgi:hypothetical protein